MVEMGDINCALTNNHQIAPKSSCCKTEIEFFNGLTFKKDLEKDITSKQQQVYSAFHLFDYNFFINKEIKSPFFNNYFPPPIIKNYTTLYQVFRI